MKKLFMTLAAVLCMSAAFTSCEKDEGKEEKAPATIENCWVEAGQSVLEAMGTQTLCIGVDFKTVKNKLVIGYYNFTKESSVDMGFPIPAGSAFQLMQIDVTNIAAKDATSGSVTINAGGETADVEYFNLTDNTVTIKTALLAAFGKETLDLKKVESIKWVSETPQPVE